MHTNPRTPVEAEVLRLQDRFLEPRTFPTRWDVSELLAPARPSNNGREMGPGGEAGLPISGSQPSEVAGQLDDRPAGLPGWKFPELKSFPVVAEHTVE